MKFRIYDAILLEMARSSDSVGANMFSDSHQSRMIGAQAKTHPKHDWAGTLAGHTLHHDNYENRHEYTTVDKNGLAVHYSVFANNKHKELPFKHTTQILAGKDKTNPKLGKGYVGSLALHHMEHTKTPLVSDSDQSPEGHKMWHHITKTAMDKGHHVYHWDGAKLNKTTPENHAEHMAKSFGKTDDHAEKHMVVSPHDLEKK